MIVLVAKTVQDPNALSELVYEEDNINNENPLGDLKRIHCFYTLGFPFRQQLLEVLLNSGYLICTSTHELILATASKQDWHNAVKYINMEVKFRPLVTVLINTFSEIFNDIPRTMTGDGQLMLR